MPTHRQVAEAVGMSVASVSRLRAGERTPGSEGMFKIQQALGWSVVDQFGVKHEHGTEGWQREFEKRLREKFDADDTSATVPGGGDRVAPANAEGDPR